MVLKITNLHILKYLSTCWLYLLECYTIDNQRCTHTASVNDEIIIISKIKRKIAMVRQHIVFLTGAGISSESGLSTFRGKNGLWTNEEWVHLASIDALYNDTQRCFGFLQHAPRAFGRGGAQRSTPYDRRTGERA